MEMKLRMRMLPRKVMPLLLLPVLLQLVLIPMLVAPAEPACDHVQQGIMPILISSSIRCCKSRSEGLTVSLL